jgi:hypothetical protein
MIIIAFSENTSKILPRILCRRFRHCAPIVYNGSDLTMYQFTKRNHIVEIHLHPRDIIILRAHGWTFIYISPETTNISNNLHAYSCVDLTKQALNIKSVFIQTPYALYKYLVHK